MVDGLSLGLALSPVRWRLRARLDTTALERKNGAAENLQARVMRPVRVLLQARDQILRADRILHGRPDPRVQNVIDTLEHNDDASVGMGRQHGLEALHPGGT